MVEHPRCVCGLSAFVAGLGLFSSASFAGIYSAPSNDPTNAYDAPIASGSDVFVGWADTIVPELTAFSARGSSSISETGFNSLGDLTSDEIAAGAAPGYLTVQFPGVIENGGGADFAVFENGFVFPSAPYLFAELAYVEVSSNGVDFARFPSISTNTTFNGGSQSFAGFDMTNVYNLAGKHASGWGTPFDLDDLLSDPLVTGGSVDLSAIAYVRLVDIPGSGDFVDSQGNPILDAWLTQGSGGFDFRLPEGLGVGAIHLAVPEPGIGLLSGVGVLGLLRRR